MNLEHEHNFEGGVKDHWNITFKVVIDGFLIWVAINNSKSSAVIEPLSPAQLNLTRETVLHFLASPTKALEHQPAKLKCTYTVLLQIRMLTSNEAPWSDSYVVKNPSNKIKWIIYYSRTIRLSESILQCIIVEFPDVLNKWERIRFWLNISAGFWWRVVLLECHWHDQFGEYKSRL